MTSWETMVADSLKRIESKLDNKVSSNYCKLQHSKLKDVQLWLSLILSVFALVGALYSGMQVIDKTDKDTDRVAYYGK